MENHATLANDLPRIAPPRMHARKPSRSPTRNRLGDDLLADLSPATTLEAFTSPSGKLKASIEAATPSERAFGLRAALASKKIQEWVTELSDWSWPAEGGSVGFEAPAAKRRKLSNSTPESHIPNEAAQSAGQTDEQPQYIGSLLAAEVERYEERVEEITDEMDDLNVEDIKRQVLDTHFSPRSRPSSSASTAPPMPTLFASYTKMDDFTAVVTATVLQALPNLSRLMRLMDVWTIRLRILRKVPTLLLALEDTETALRSGWNVVGSSVNDEASVLEEECLSRHTFSTMMEVLQRKVADLGKDLDFMLDTLEGKEDTLPDDWLDRMDLIEKDYGEWTVAGDRKVCESEWAVAEKKRKEDEEVRRLKEEHLAELKAEQEALEHARLQALKDAELAEAARLDAVAKEIARVEIEREAARFEALRLAEVAESARIAAEKQAQDLARRRAEEKALEIASMEATKKAEAARIEAGRIEAARIETEQKADAENQRRIAEEIETLRIVELARIESSRIEEEQKLKLETERRAAELKAETDRLEVLRIADLAIIKAARVEAENAAQETARRRAEEEDIARLKLIQEAEAARVEAERKALEINRQQAEASEILRLQAVKAAEVIKLKAEQEAQALAAKKAGDEILESIRPKDLHAAEEAESARTIAPQEQEELVQRKAQLETGPDVKQESASASQATWKSLEPSHHEQWPRQDVTSVSGDDTKQQLSPKFDKKDITFKRNQPISPPNKSVPAAPMGAVPSTVAVGLGISALAFLHKSEQESCSPSSLNASSQNRSSPHRYSDLDGATDESLLMRDDPTYDPSRISRHSLEMPQEMILDSGISSPIQFQSVEPQTPTLGSPIRFGGHFDVPRKTSSNSPSSSPSRLCRKSRSPAQEEQTFSISPSTPKSIRMARHSHWAENINSPDALSLDSTVTPRSPKLVDAMLNYDGAADTADSTSSTVSTGWIVVSPSDEREEDSTMTLSHESDPPEQSTVSAVSTLPNSLAGSLVTPMKYSSTLIDRPEEIEDVSILLSPVMEEDVIPSIEIDSLDGTCEACNSYDRDNDEDSSPARKRTISVGRFDTYMRRSSSAHRDSVSSDTSTIINTGEDSSSRVGSPQIDNSFLDSLPEDAEQSSSTDRFGYRNRDFFEYSPPPSPSATPRLAKQRSLQVLRTPYGFGDFSAPATPLDAPTLDNIKVTATPITRNSNKTGSHDQLQQQISSLLETIPAHIRLSAEQDSTPTAQTLRLKKTRRSVTPSIRPSSSTSNYSTSSRAVTPSFTLAPVFSKTTQRSRGSIGNPEIKLYHLSRSTGEPPIKLFVRLVGEQGERVMVRVGGGWADLGEYLKEYASHHGRRSALEGGEKIEIQDLPARIASGSSITSTSTMRNTGRSTSLSRPASVMGSRPGSSLEVRKTRRSVSTTDSAKPNMPSRLTNVRNDDKIPVTPLPSTRTRAYGTPPSAASVVSSNGTGHSVVSGHSTRLTWGEEDSSLGLAGPNAKKIVISERDQEWVESMKEKVKLASAEKERRTRERERLDREHLEREQDRRTSFGEIGGAGGVKRLFRKGLDRSGVHKDEKGRAHGL